MNISTDKSTLNVHDILDRRKDGTTAYYYIKRETVLGDVYTWEPKDKLSLSKDLIDKVDKEFNKKQKQKKKRELKKNTPVTNRKVRLREKLLPCCDCATDSPWDPNRSFRGSLCDFN